MAIPDSPTLPEPSTQMYTFYEGLDSNLFSESTGINHNAATKWLRVELLVHLDYLSYLLSIKNDAVIMSDDIVHTDSILDYAVTMTKLSQEVQDKINGNSIFNVIERNSVQTYNCLSDNAAADGNIIIQASTILSQAGGFDTLGQVDTTEKILVTTPITQTVGETLTGFLYKEVGGVYTQYTTEQAILNHETMIGSKVFLGTFKVNASGFVYDTVSAIPTTHLRNVDIHGELLDLPESGGVAWDIIINYDVGDTVSLNNVLYIAKVANIAKIPTSNPTEWHPYSTDEYGGVLWKDTVTYVLGDVVSEGGKAYIALTTTLNELPSSTPLSWGVASGDAVGLWNSATSYAIGDMATEDGGVYVAITNNGNKLPSASTSDWVKDKVIVNNTTTSTSTTEALSAARGKFLQDNKITRTNYATATLGGTIKAKLVGSTAYITIDGTDA